MLSQVGIVSGQADVYDLIGEAYDKLVEVSGNGGDVSELVLLLNVVVAEVNSGEYDTALVSSELESILVQAEALNVRSLRVERDLLLTVAATAAVVILVEYYLWRVFPDHYWSQWLRRRGDWIVE